jgi:hypothetical protein
VSFVNSFVKYSKAGGTIMPECSITLPKVYWQVQWCVCAPPDPHTTKTTMEIEPSWD